MRLDKFIEQTLFSIAEGLKGANLKMSSDDYKPYGINEFRINKYVGSGKDKANIIHFDVAVSVSSELGANGGGSKGIR